MTPEDYEHHVANLLRSEGWEASVTPHQRDHGVDIVAERGGERMAVQAKMFGGSNRPVNAQVVMELYGAAAYADCAIAMIATDGRVLPDAERSPRSSVLRSGSCQRRQAAQPALSRAARERTAQVRLRRSARSGRRTLCRWQGPR